MFKRFVSHILRHRFLTAALCLLLVAGSALFVPRFIANLSGVSLEVNNSQSEQTKQLLREHFPGFPSEQGIVVFHSESATVDDPSYQQLVERTQRALHGKPHVISLVSPYAAGSEMQISADRHTALMVVNLEGSGAELQKNSAILRDALPEPNDGINLYLTGPSALNADVIEQEHHDIARAEMIGLPVAFLVLLVAFGTMVGAGLPLALGALGIVTTFGILGATGHLMAFDVFTESAVTMLGLALGIDYSLMIVTRFREELAAGKSPHDATTATMQTAGRAVLFSGFTVLISLSGLLLVQSELFRGLAVGTMLTVSVMMLLCLTLLPVVLSWLGSRVNRLAVPRLHRHATSRPRNPWGRWAHVVMRHPVLLGLGAVALLLVLAWPAHNLQLGLNMGASTLKDQPSAQGLHLIERQFASGIVSPVQIVAYREGAPLTEDDLAVLATIQTQLQSRNDVALVGSLPQTLDAAFGSHDTAALAALGTTPEIASSQLNVTHGSNTTVMTVILRVSADSKEAQTLLSDIRERIVPDAADKSNLQFGYIGSTSLISDLNAEIKRSVPIVLAYVLGLSFVLLAFAFRSLALPLKAILMNMFALSATFGLVVVVFQYGLGEQLLDFTSPGYIQNYLPLLTFVILFGLSMDYEVLLLSRIQEEWNRTHDNTEAVASGIEHTAKVITHAAAIMVVVFLSFLIAHMLEIKQLGFALAVAVLLDATLIRLLLVPATMRLMGKWNWWAPRWLARRQK